MCQYPGEDLNADVKRPRETSGFCNLVAEDVSMDICPNGMVEDYWIYLDNLSFSSVSRLMDVTTWTNKLIIMNSRSSSLIRPTWKKRPMIAVAEKDKAAKASSSKKIPYSKKGTWIPRLVTIVKRRGESDSSLRVLEKWEHHLLAKGGVPFSTIDQKYPSCL